MTVKGKIRLRELCLRGLTWHEAVNDEDTEWWNQYLHTMQQLRDIEFPRCLFPKEDEILQTELHTVTDASEGAVVCYI